MVACTVFRLLYSSGLITFASDIPYRNYVVGIVFWINLKSTN